MSVSEADILNNLKGLGIPKDNFVDAANDTVLRVVRSFVETTTEAAKRALIDSGHSATGSTAASLRPEVQVIPGRIRFTLFADPHAEYVDQGVSGTQKKHQTPYSFRTDKPNKKMADSIRKWIPARGIQLPQGIKTYESLSYAIAVHVKREGIKPTKFITNTFDQNTINGLARALTTELKTEFTATFKRMTSGANNT